MVPDEVIWDVYMEDFAKATGNTGTNYGGK